MDRLNLSSTGQIIKSLCSKVTLMNLLEGLRNAYTSRVWKSILKGQISNFVSFLFSDIGDMEYKDYIYTLLSTTQQMNAVQNHKLGEYAIFEDLFTYADLDFETVVEQAYLETLEADLDSILKFEEKVLFKFVFDIVLPDNPSFVNALVEVLKINPNNSLDFLLSAGARLEVPNIVSIVTGKKCNEKDVYLTQKWDQNYLQVENWPVEEQEYLKNNLVYDYKAEKFIVCSEPSRKNTFFLGQIEFTNYLFTV